MYTEYYIRCQLSSTGYLLSYSFETLALHLNGVHRHHRANEIRISDVCKMFYQLNKSNCIHHLPNLAIVVICSCFQIVFLEIRR